MRENAVELHGRLVPDMLKPGSNSLPAFSRQTCAVVLGEGNIVVDQGLWQQGMATQKSRNGVAGAVERLQTPVARRAEQLPAYAERVLRGQPHTKRHRTEQDALIDLQPSKARRTTQKQHCPREGTGVLKRAAPKSAAKPASDPAADMHFFVGLHPGQTGPMATGLQDEKGAQTAILHSVIGC